MSSHDHHDLERLAELAASDPRGPEARRMVSDCKECAQEFRLQREAIRYLTEGPVPQLTDDERSKLRVNTWTSLEEAPVTRMEPETRPPDRGVAPLTPRRPWYPKVIGFAAVMAMTVALGYALGGGGLDMGGDTDSLAMEDTEDTSGTVPAAALADETASSEDDDVSATTTAEITEETVVEDIPAATTAAGGPATDTTAAAGEGDEGRSPDVAAAAAGPLGSAEIAALVEHLRRTAAARGADSLTVEEAEAVCITELGIDEILTVDSITSGDSRLTVVSRRGDRETEAIVFDADTCTEVELPE